MERAEPQEPRDDKQVESEGEAAGAEAASIGGTAGDEEMDPAERPVAEAGGGVDEGFEQSEEALQESAEQGEAFGDPRADAFTPEAEADRSQAAYAESGEIESTEVVSDPDEGPDDPGAGPGLAAER